MSVRTQAPNLPTASVCWAASPKLAALNLGLEENEVANSKSLALGTIEISNPYIGFLLYFSDIL